MPTVKPVSRVPFAFNLAKLDCTFPSYKVKIPPTNIFPSVCSAIVVTEPLKPEPVVKPVSRVPSAFNLVIRVWATPLYKLKSPTSNIFPSVCSAMARTELLKPVPVVKPASRMPSALNLTIRFCEVLLWVVKVPPTNIFPSD